MRVSRTWVFCALVAVGCDDDGGGGGGDDDATAGTDGEAGGGGEGGVAGEGGAAGEGGVAGEGGAAGEGGVAGEGGAAGEGGVAGEGGMGGEGGVAGEGGGAGEGGAGGGPQPPGRVTLVADDGFEDPLDAVVSPDGMTIFFTAHDPAAPRDASASVFRVPTAGGEVRKVVGAPLENPTGLVASCNGGTLYVADLGRDAGDPGDRRSVIYEIDVLERRVTPIPAMGIGEAAGLAFDEVCSTLYVTGYTPEGEPALFSLPPRGGQATVIKRGAPLVSPSGVYLDTNGTAFVVDHGTYGLASAAVFAIQANGVTAPIAQHLTVSEPAGISLVQGGRFAVIPSRNVDGAGQLLIVDTDSGQPSVLETPDLVEPGGIRTALNAPVMVVVDADGNAIYRAE